MFLVAENQQQWLTKCLSFLSVLSNEKHFEIVTKTRIFLQLISFPQNYHFQFFVLISHSCKKVQGMKKNLDVLKATNRIFSTNLCFVQILVMLFAMKESRTMRIQSAVGTCLSNLCFVIQRILHLISTNQYRKCKQTKRIVALVKIMGKAKNKENIDFFDCSNFYLVNRIKIFLQSIWKFKMFHFNSASSISHFIFKK